MATINLPYIAWRDGRPRFKTSRRERDLGFEDQDLRHPNGAWFTVEQAAAFAWPKYAEILACRGYENDQATALIAAAKEGRILRLTPRSRPRKLGQMNRTAEAAIARANTNEQLIEDWLKALEEETDPDDKLSPVSIESYRKSANAILYRPETRGERKAREEKERAAETLGLPVPERARETFALAPPASIDKIALNEFYKYLKRTRGNYMARGCINTYSAAYTWGGLSPRWRLGPNPRHALELTAPAGRIVIYDDSELRTLIAVADHIGRPSIGDSLVLGIWTSQRQTDRLLLKDEGLVDGRRQIRQSKTKKLVPVKETPQLAERLAAARARVAALALKFGLRPETIVVNEATCTPYDDDTYRHWFSEVRRIAIAGVVDQAAMARRGRNDPEPAWLIAPCPSLIFTRDDGTQSFKQDRDLRDTAVTWLARAGCTMAEICAISGHSAKSVQTIIEHYLGATRELGDAAIDKLTAWMEREGIAV